MTEERSESTVLDDAPVQLELGGQSYAFVEPGNRVRRKLMRRVLSLAKIVDGCETDPVLALEAADHCLDFLYEAVPACRKDQAFLDDHASEKEITAAYKRVVEVLVVPFAARNPPPAVEATEESSPKDGTSDTSPG